jgi:hypothetical protein
MPESDMGEKVKMGGIGTEIGQHLAENKTKQNQIEFANWPMAASQS